MQHTPPQPKGAVKKLERKTSVGKASNIDSWIICFLMTSSDARRAATGKAAQARRATNKDSLPVDTTSAWPWGGLPQARWLRGRCRWRWCLGLNTRLNGWRSGRHAVWQYPRHFRA